MRIRPSVFATLLAGALMAPAWASIDRAIAEGDSPAGANPSAAPEATAGTLEPPPLSLRGPFGRVVGGPLDDPATAPPDRLPLDAYVRRAPLVIEGESAAPLGRLEVVATYPAEPGVEDVLSVGSSVFAGPDRPGDSVIVATLTGAAGDVSQHAWLIDVPDRPPPEDGFLDIPAPEVIVSSGAGRAAGMPGHGCYAYLCVETGDTPPPQSLRPLSVRVGETLMLSLGDGSALTAWEGSLTPLGRGGEERHASGLLTGMPLAEVELSGLAVPSTGHWLLELEVEFDRQRGFLQTHQRLVAD